MKIFGQKTKEKSYFYFHIYENNCILYYIFILTDYEKITKIL